MKVAYVLHWLKGPESGVFKKVLAHRQAWAAQGVDVRLFVLTQAGSAASGAWAAAGVPTTEVTFTDFRSRFVAATRLFRAVRAWNADVIYRRFNLYYPGFGRLARRIPVVLEVNTDDLAEGELAGRDLAGFRKRLWNRTTRGITLRQAAGAVFVTHELAAAPHFRRYGRPSVVIANGIHIGTEQPPDPPANARPRLFFIGFPGQAWHGIDKMYSLARHCPEFDLDLVGVPPEDVPDDLRGRVTGHGALTLDAYRPLLERADVALGSFGLHRKGMEEGCSLKLREYLSQGLPTIIGYRDTDFPDPEPFDFLLALPNTPDNVDASVPQIRAFVERWRGRRFPIERVRHLDSFEKEKRRLEFFRAVRAGSA